MDGSREASEGPRRRHYCGGMRKTYVEAVLALVDMIPQGSVLSYGDIAELLGAGGPRQVGAVMSHHGSSVGWWRVLRASGEFPENHGEAALRHYLQETTPMKGNPGEFLRNGTAGWRVDLRLARWQPSESDFARIEALARQLAPFPLKMSDADDGMTT